MSIYFHHKTSDQIAKAGEEDTMILIPVGQIEEHGFHLPLETDTIIARETSRIVAEEIRSEIPVLVLPTVWMGYSVQQVGKWPGLITFREPETMIQMVYDILESLIKNGFKKMVFINAHGNNPAILELACRKIGSDHGVFPAVTYVLGMSKGVGPKVRQSVEGGCGGHAGEEETALMLHLAPELVSMDRASEKDIVQYHTRFFPGDIYSEISDKVSGIYWSTWGVVNSESGVYGDPTAASAETGRLLFKEIRRNYYDFLKEYYKHNQSQQ